MNRSQFAATVLLLMILTGWTTPINADMQYNVIDLGLGQAHSINNNGQIAGESFYGYDNDGRKIFGPAIFDSTGQGNNIKLGTFPGTVTNWATSINNNGQVVGQCYDDTTGIQDAVLWDSTGQGNNIKIGYGIAKSINDNGQIVGSLGDAFLYDPTGQGNNVTLWHGVANSINNSGQIAGNFNAYPSPPYAVIFDPAGQGNIINLGGIGGSNSSARSINDNGQVVGHAYDSSGYNHAVLFDSTGGGNNINLTPFPITGTQSYAYSINNNGQIVGEASLQATLFDPTGQGSNINLSAFITQAYGFTFRQTKAECINDNGWIVGYGIDTYNNSHAFLLTPVPEPGTVLLLGLGGLVLRKRVKK